MSYNYTNALHKQYISKTHQTYKAKNSRILINPDKKENILSLNNDTVQISNEAKELAELSSEGDSSQPDISVTQSDSQTMGLLETQEEVQENNELLDALKNSASKAKNTTTSPSQSQSSSSTVTFNQAKRARQLAAAQTEADVRAILNLLYQDLSECRAGVIQGMCDEAEVAKVQVMITRARSRMGTIAASNKNKNQDEDQLSLSYLNVLM